MLHVYTFTPLDSVCFSTLDTSGAQGSKTYSKPLQPPPLHENNICWLRLISSSAARFVTCMAIFLKKIHIYIFLNSPATNILTNTGIVSIFCVYKTQIAEQTSHTFWTVDFYKGVDNDKEIHALLKEYEMGKIVQDVEHFTAMRHDMVDEHPNVQNLEKVLDRILEYILKT